MSILISKDTKVITQGITGKTGQFHTRMCREYANGKNCFVAGVNPKKAGEDFEGIPIYASVGEAAAASGATVSVIYVPPAGAAAAIWEAVEADLDLVVCITEGIPIRDMLDVRNKTEYNDGHLPGADQLSGGRVMWHLDQLPEPGAGTIVTYCQSGVRNSVAASALRRAGYDIAELEGSYLGWVARSGKTPELVAA